MPHHADLHRAATHFGFARLDAVRSFEAHMSDLALRGEIPIKQPDAEEQGHDRHDPDRIPTLGALNLGLGCFW